MRAGSGCKSVKGGGGGGIFFRNVLMIFSIENFHIKNQEEGVFFKGRFYLLNPEKTITYF